MNIYSFILLLAAPKFAIAGGVVGFICIILGIFIGCFLLGRAILLWYWKIDVIVRNQEYQTALLQQQIDLMAQQINLLKQLNAKA